MGTLLITSHMMPERYAWWTIHHPIMPRGVKLYSQVQPLTALPPPHSKLQPPVLSPHLLSYPSPISLCCDQNYPQPLFWLPHPIGQHPLVAPYCLLNQVSLVTLLCPLQLYTQPTFVEMLLCPAWFNLILPTDRNGDKEDEGTFTSTLYSSILFLFGFFVLFSGVFFL